MADSEDKGPIEKEDLPSAEKIAALEFTDKERELMLDGVNDHYHNYIKLRDIKIDNAVSPSLGFDPRPMPSYYFTPDHKLITTPVDIERPDDDESIAYLPLTHLAYLIKSEQITSMELTELYLSRLKKYDEILECVITYTEEIAYNQAKMMDKEISNGNYRGILHGIPYGIKDLFSHPKYNTTWGAMPFKDQKRKEKATVISLLETAGAVLIAKLSMGALAWGETWFNGVTKSPFNIDIGSSGSSAGSAAAVAAGLVGFGIGTETYGSIISPSTRCGTTGLRPTFGRVSRHGAMALSWSMDKIGPICRTVEDCAIVFDAIHGIDGKDPHMTSKSFSWSYQSKVENLKVGYDPETFDKDEDDVQSVHDKRTLDQLRELGIDLVEFSTPDYPINQLSLILSAEAATAFDELTRNNEDDLLVRQMKDAWPNKFREARLIPAVEYIKANRIRRLLIQEMSNKFKDIDVYVAPSFSEHLLLTNLTGHPAVVVPNGVNENTNIPTSITFIGDLYKEKEVLNLAKFYQDNTDYLRIPDLQKQVETYNKRNE